MKVAVIGSRGLTIDNLERYLPPETTEIISGGARGIDACAKEYAIAHSIKLTEFLPEYEKYGRSAPLKRNITIIKSADIILAFWDGKSNGTRFVINKCREMGKELKVEIVAS
ncbi:MAG: DNA-protecting protein DprA [Oscillospiraceae bacterium]|nr:DNA-protecting protein DprA [Oscillospiraceae bacterium]